MLDARPADEAEMILAFLRAELASPRYGHATRAALAECGDSRLVTDPDLGSAAENDARACALTRTRGWGDRTELFEGFPYDVSWSHGQLTSAELAAIRYIDYSYWNELSGGTRRPADVKGMLARGEFPQWLAEMDRGWIDELGHALRANGSLVDLVVMTAPDTDELVVLEGHSRLTALFVAELAEEIPVFAYLGSSANIRSWTAF